MGKELPLLALQVVNQVVCSGFERCVVLRAAPVRLV